jgi:Zn finger protein HypA/HybF involved in hydrogenase expression
VCRVLVRVGTIVDLLGNEQERAALERHMRNDPQRVAGKQLKQNGEELACERCGNTVDQEDPYHGWKFCPWCAHQIAKDVEPV